MNRRWVPSTRRHKADIGIAFWRNGGIQGLSGLNRRTMVIMAKCCSSNVEPADQGTQHPVTGHAQCGILCEQSHACAQRRPSTSPQQAGIRPKGSPNAFFPKSPGVALPTPALAAPSVARPPPMGQCPRHRHRAFGVTVKPRWPIACDALSTVVPINAGVRAFQPRTST